MSKYRIRLSNGRVIGPLDISQICELKVKKHITGKEQMQVFPTGDWLAIANFSDVVEALKNPNEFIIKKENTVLIKLKQQESLVEDDPVDSGVEDETVVEENEFVEMQVDKQRPVQTQEDVGNKTIISKDTLKFLEEEKKRKEQEDKEKEIAKAAAEEKERKERDISTDSTQMFNLSALSEDEEDIKTNELMLELEEKKQQIKRKQEIKKKIIADKRKSEEEDDEEEENDGGKKKKIIILAIALAIAAIFLSPEEKKVDKKVFKAIVPKFEFPIDNEKIDEKKSNEFYKLAEQEIVKDNYPSLVAASGYYFKSVEAKYIENPSLPKLILTYIDLLKFSKDRLRDGSSVFQMLQIFYPRYLTNVEMNNAYGMFFYYQKMYETAYRYMRKYLDAGMQPTKRYFADLITISINAGKYSEAKVLYEKLSSVAGSDPYSINALFHYNVKNNNYDEAARWLKIGIDKNPNSMLLLVDKAELDVYLQDYKSLATTLGIMKDLLFNGSEYYRAKYYEYQGILSLVAKKNEEAAEFFKKASEWPNNESLSDRLSKYDPTNFPEASILIRESKSREFIALTKQNLIDRNYTMALLNASNAKEIAPDYIPATVTYANVLRETGYFRDAINSMSKLRENHQTNADVNYMLIDLYIDSYKFSEATQIFQLIGATGLRDDYRFFSLNAKMNMRMGRYLEAIRWLQESLQKNPLNDKDYYRLGEIFFIKKKFGRCKTMYNKAIELNPLETEYRVAYSRIVYEESGVDASIGYLRDLLRDFPADPAILGQIAINYYKTGQNLFYEKMIKQIQELPRKDEKVYEYLIKNSELNERFEDVITYSKKLLEIKPGDLKTRMFLVELLIDLSRPEEAIGQLEFIRSRLDTYPRLNYNLSRISLMAGQPDKAMEFAEKEVKENPNIEDGFVLFGNILKEKGELQDAEKNFRKALQINPNSVDGLSGLAYVNVKRNNLDTALDLYAKAIDLAPSKPEIRKSIGDVYRIIGQSALAIENYRVYLELLPNSKYKAEIETYIRNFE